VPQEQRARHRFGPGEQLIEVVLGPAGEREGDRLRSAANARLKRWLRVLENQPYVRRIQPSTRDQARVPGSDDLVEAAVLHVVLQLLAEVLLGGGPVGAVELRQGGPDGLHEYGSANGMISDTALAA